MKNESKLHYSKKGDHIVPFFDYKKDKSTIEFFYGYTKTIDNDPEIASIVIEDETGQLHGYGQDEIDSIEVLG